MYCSKDKESVSDFISRSDPKIKKKYEFLLRFIADETNQLNARDNPRFCVKSLRSLQDDI